jgi:uncharacterized protein
VAEVVVTGLYVYPVKSTRGIARARVRLTATGFEWDRQWMVIDGKGTFLSQRTHPKLATIVPRIAGTELKLSAPGRAVLTLPLTADGERVAVRVWRDACVGVDQGAVANEWVSGVLSQAVQLVRVAPEMQRLADRKFVGSRDVPLGFPDGYPILICNEASLEDLNSRLPQKIPIERFRPNIVVRGLPPWAEDHIDTMSIGPVTLKLVKPCTRCSIPGLDHLTGERSTDPMPVLREFRFDKSLLGVKFGENAIIEQGAGLAIERGSHCSVTAA